MKQQNAVFASLLFSCAISGIAQPYWISTFAGADRLRDGQQAVGTPLSYPSAAVVDRSGNLYIADSGDNRVRKVSPSGVISTYAGTGDPGFSGDGGPATLARIDNVRSLAVDALGNLYLADRNNYRVRRISPAGTISTIVGKGKPNNADRFQEGGPATSSVVTPTAVAVDSQGSVYVADLSETMIIFSASGIELIGACTVRKIDASGVGSTIAPKGSFGEVNGITFDATGNMYLSNSTDYKVTKVTKEGVVSTIPGTGSIHAWGVAADANGDLYVVDKMNNRVRKIDGKSGITSVFAGDGGFGFAGDGGQAANARLAAPSSIAFGPTGDLWLADSFNKRVRRINRQGIIDTVAGADIGDGGMAIQAFLNAPVGMSIDPGGSLVFADAMNYRIRKVDRTGDIASVAGVGYSGFTDGGGNPSSAMFRSPAGVAVDKNGVVFVADTGNHRIRKIAGTSISTFAGTGTSGFSGDGGPAAAAKLDTPTAVAVDGLGNVYVADWDNFRIRKISTGGIISTFAGTGGAGSTGDGGPADKATLSPRDIAVDRDGNLFVVDDENHRIRKITPAGTISTFAGTTKGFSGDGGPAVQAQLNFPTGVAVDADGNVYICDWDNYRVRRVDRTGRISTVAGNGRGHAVADSGPALGAQLDPQRVFAGAKGEIYVADTVSSRIWTVAPRSPATIGVVSGDGQTGMVGEQLSQPLSVLVTDAAGAPMSGVIVAFAVSSGEATLKAKQVVTDNQGVGANTVTLGSTPGAITITATVPGLAPVVFQLAAAPPGPPTISLTLEPNTVERGDPSSLQWVTAGATRISIEPEIGVVAAKGTMSVSPTVTTTYMLTATGPSGSSTASATLNVVEPRPRIDLVINAADPEAPFTPGSRVLIRGAKFAERTFAAEAPDLPTRLGGISVVDTDGRLFPVFSVSPTEIVFLLSAELIGRQNEVWIRVEKVTGETSEYVRLDLVAIPGQPRSPAASRSRPEFR